MEDFVSDSVQLKAIICESVSLGEVVTGAGKLVVARIPSTNTAERGSSARPSETMREVRFLSCLSDPNIARVLGICNATDSSPCWTIMEYTELGDLAHYLQYSVPLTGTLRPASNLKALRYFTSFKNNQKRISITVKICNDENQINGIFFFF